ncbi:hypothetical protein FACS1894190_15120 [Spirochaetia bacterium]|nr:hypothetical protein FACS1894190_15120 [Spirochaetia bacterium]
MDLLDYYRDNLNYIRTLAAEFATEYPKIAGRLNLSEFECLDPYIERLLEGTAFLSAKVEKKLDEGYHGFLESVLNSVSPSTLYPVPSGAICDLALAAGNDKLKRGITLEAGAAFEAGVPGISTPCTFTTVCDIPLLPFTVSDAAYLSGDLSLFDIKNTACNAALHLTLDPLSHDAELGNGIVSCFLNMADNNASILQRQLLHDVCAVYIKKPEDSSFDEIFDIEFELPVYFLDSSNKVLAKNNTRGLEIFKQFLLYPFFFKFFSIKNLNKYGRTAGGAIELVIAFKRREQGLLSSVKNTSIKLNCAPVLNIFEKRSERIYIENEKYEFHIIPDRAAMHDYEVVDIKKIDFYNERNENIFAAVGFYARNTHNKDEKNLFFGVKRRRLLVERKSQARSSYNGSEVFVSFAADGIKISDASQAAADIVATNRDLPLLLNKNAEIISKSPLIEKCTFVTVPTRPAYPIIDKGGEDDFSRLSHIIFNISAMFWEEGSRPLELFRVLLRTYPIRSAEERERISDGVVELSCKPHSFRYVQNGMVFFEMGWKIVLVLDETPFTGMGSYTFAYILAEMIKSFSYINTILDIDYSTVQSGHIATWANFKN